ncbi:MAG: hypothetical protein ACXADY_22215 [Candidatus Hodarchaeales archaeon]
MVEDRESRNRSESPSRKRKKLIKEGIKHLPVHIGNYSQEEQTILNNFLALIKQYEKADKDRETLSTEIQMYLKKIRLKEQAFLKLPFYWFVDTYFTKSNLLLSLAEFHGTSFYKYLTESLIGDPKTVGLFQLLRKGIPLTDLAWEELQYFSARMKVPLTEKQLQVIKAVYTFLPRVGLHSLTLNRLRTAIQNQVEFSIKSKELIRLFALLDDGWVPWFYPPAFGLKHYYVNFQLSKSTSLKDIIDFKNPKNTTLCNSRIYRSLDFEKNYSGYLVIPDYMTEHLLNYLQQCKNRRLLILNELLEVTKIYTSTSFALYEKKGWKHFPPLKIRRLTKVITSNHTSRRRPNYPSSFQTAPFSDGWNYKQHPEPSRIMSLYCKVNCNAPFKTKDLDQTINQLNLDKSELSIMKELLQKQVFQLTFYLTGLIYEFSRADYIIILPIMPFEELKRLISWLPYARIIFTDKNIFLVAYLTIKIAQWLSEELGLHVLSVTPHYYSPQPDFAWFDQKSLNWLPPLILK